MPELTRNSNVIGEPNPERRRAAPTPNARTNEDAEALHSAQMENFELRQQLKKLKLDKNSREVEARASSKEPSDEPPNPGPGPNGLVDNDGEIAKHGRKYSLMISPWLDANIFDDLQGRPDIDPNSEARYDNKANMRAGTIAELYDFLPQKLHSLMAHSRFGGTFRTQLQSARSNAVLSVRQKAGFLYNKDQRLFETTFNRATLPEFQSLLKLPKEDGYTLFAPILFEGERYDHTLRKLFKNPLLPGMAKIMLFGKSSTTRSKPQTLADIWKVTSATPGLIAFTAILARFLLSPEEELRKVGRVTQINWLEDFTRYKRILSTDTKKVREVFRFFNEIVFDHSPAPNAISASNTNDNMEEFEDAMRAFGVDDSSEDENDADSLRGSLGSSTRVSEDGDAFEGVRDLSFCADQEDDGAMSFIAVEKAPRRVSKTVIISDDEGLDPDATTVVVRKVSANRGDVRPFYIDQDDAVSPTQPYDSQDDSEDAAIVQSQPRDVLYRYVTKDIVDMGYSRPRDADNVLDGFDADDVSGMAPLVKKKAHPVQRQTLLSDNEDAPRLSDASQAAERMDSRKGGLGPSPVRKPSSIVTNQAADNASSFSGNSGISDAEESGISKPQQTKGRKKASVAKTAVENTEAKKPATRKSSRNARAERGD